MGTLSGRWAYNDFCNASEPADPRAGSVITVEFRPPDEPDYTQGRVVAQTYVVVVARRVRLTVSELFHSSAPRVHRPSRRRRPAAAVGSQFVETLENRKLMSVTLDLRLPGGGKSATVTSVGQKIGLEVWATVKGANTSTTDDGFQKAHGSLLSTNVNGGAANGTLAVTLASPFNGGGATPGSQRDLDGDGDLDVGSNDNSTDLGFFQARADAVRPGTSFKIGTAVFTVTSLKSTTGQTNLVYRTRASSLQPLWVEDTKAKVPMHGGVVVNGSPVVLKRSGSTTPTTYSISGNVWNDTDADRVKDSGETNRSGARVYVDKDRDGVYDSGEQYGYTNTSGNYTITGVPSGSTRVRVVPPSGYRVSTPISGYHDLTLSGNTSGRNFGVTNKPLTYSLSGHVFTDSDGDGIKDSGEYSRSGVKVYLDKDKDGVLDSGEKYTYTNSSGNYAFTGLTAGSTRVRIVGISGYRISTPSAGYHDFYLSGNTSGRNFGVTQKTLITGRAWVDSDKDGYKDSTESVLSNWMVFIDKDKDGRYDSGETYTRTDSAGNYRFTGLSAGTHRVRIVQASGYTRISPTSGYFEKYLSNGQTWSNNNFRFTKP